MTDRRIVVGVDGSPSSLAALTWAVDQAALTSAAVHAVSAWSPPSAYGGYPLIAVEDWEGDAANALDSVLADIPARLGSGSCDT